MDLIVNTYRIVFFVSFSQNVTEDSLKVLWNLMEENYCMIKNTDAWGKQTKLVF